MLIFALDTAEDLGAGIARELGIDLAAHEIRSFEDGEHKGRPLTPVRARDVYVVQALHGDLEASPNDKLCELLFFAAAVRDAGATRVTAVLPYLAYARKDRRTQPRDPVTTRYVAQLIEAVGIDRVVAVDVHNLAAFENAFRCPTIHLVARPLFVAHLLPLVGKRELAVVSPDAGGAKRAELLREAFVAARGGDVALAFLQKRRVGGVVGGEARVIGAVDGRAAVIVDDLVSSGTTLARAAAACREGGAASVYAAVTHGLFTGNASQVLEEADLERLLLTNTVPPFRLPPEMVRDRLTVLDATPLLAEAIRRLHQGEPLEGLGGFGLAQASSEPPRPGVEQGGGPSLASPSGSRVR
jgi:ribose-phosphate pyrophosphokinase